MKFPINQLLYLVILGLLGLSGWQFWEALQEQKSGAGTSNKEVLARTAELVQTGRSRKADRKGPDYAAKEPWASFRAANLIGKEPPPPPTPQDVEEEPKPVEKVETPLEDICDIRVIFYDGERSLVTIEYKETANVQLPADLLEERSNAVGRPMPMPSRPRGVAPPTMPTGSAASGVVQQLALEDDLWPPYDHIRLVRVAENARYAEFVRSKNGDESEPEKFFKDELEMGQELLAKLEEIKARGDVDLGALPTERADGDDVGVVIVTNDWRGSNATARIGNDYHVGTDDWDDWGRDPQRVLNQEIGTRSYSRGNTRGVQITKVSPRFREFGVVSGDVVTSINGQPVSSKAEAIKVGKQLYKRGVRNFQVTFLSRGREVTRNYVAPNK